MQLFQSWVRKLAGIALMALLVSGCGGGGGEDSSASAQDGSAGNAAPTIQGSPGTAVLAGQTYSFQPTANDPNSDALTFSVTNLPAWATFNTSTGRVSGSPTAADVATYSGITISVSDGQASATLGPFSINVTGAGNGTALLTWVPPTQNSDGTTLTNLAGYMVMYGPTADDLQQSVSLTNPSLSSYMVENLTSGTWFFAVVAVNSSGVTSQLSNVASKTIT
jgi:Putative Ig domain